MHIFKSNNILDISNSCSNFTRWVWVQNIVFKCNSILGVFNAWNLSDILLKITENYNYNYTYKVQNFSQVEVQSIYIILHCNLRLLLKSISKCNWGMWMILIQDICWLLIMGINCKGWVVFVFTIFMGTWKYIWQLVIK